MSKIARDNRNADIAKIQIARKQLAMTEEDYRAMLQGVGGVTSSTALDYDGRQRILAHLRRMGWRLKASTNTAPKRPKRPTPAADKLPLVRRIRAQLISLDRKPDEYADGIARQMLGTAAPEFFEWCHMDDLYKISQALGVEQHRKGARTHA